MKASVNCCVVLFFMMGMHAYAEPSLAELEARLSTLERRNIELRILLAERENRELGQRVNKRGSAETGNRPASKFERTPVAHSIPKEPAAHPAFYSASAIAPDLTRSSRTGFYVGVSAGMNWTKASGSLSYDYTPSAYVPSPTFSGPTVPYELTNLPVNVPSLSQFGGIGTVTMGYDKMFSDNLFAGVEADVSYLRFSKSVKVRASGTTLPYTRTDATTNYVTTWNNASTMNGTVDVSSNWLATLRGRMGFATPSWAVFWTAGIAFSDVSASTLQITDTVENVSWPGGGGFTDNGAVRINGNQSRVLIGGAASIGAEYSLSENIKLRSELLYYHLGSMKIPLSLTYPVQKSTATLSIDASGTILRSGLMYKF